MGFRGATVCRVQIVDDLCHPLWEILFNKFPFGISSALEHFQRRMSELLADIPGVLRHIDDIVIFGDTKMSMMNDSMQYCKGFKLKG